MTGWGAEGRNTYTDDGEGRKEGREGIHSWKEGNGRTEGGTRLKDWKERNMFQTAEEDYNKKGRKEGTTEGREGVQLQRHPPKR